MALVLVRVDDRLIHGQVVEGWLRVIQAERIVVACDRAAADSLQIGLMRLAVPERVAVDVLTVPAALEDHRSGRWEKERVLLLVASVGELFRLIEGGLSVASVNLGGVHMAPGRTMVAPHLGWTREEKDCLLKLVERKIIVETRALPTDHARPIQEWLVTVP